MASSSTISGEGEVSSRGTDNVERENSRQGLGNASIHCGTDAGCGFADAENRAADTKERSRSVKRLCLAVALCLFFMILEIAGGVKANSLAILTDAAHLLSDVAGFAISLFAIWASSWEATPRQSYGFFRLEILGALLSIQLIWLITGILVYEAIDRMINNNSRPVDGKLMFIVATFGLIVNFSMVFVLGHEHGHSHGHSHAHGHEHSHGDAHGHEHSHADSHSHEHGIEHSQHDHKEEHSHGHDEEHHHRHSHEDEIKEPLLISSHSTLRRSFDKKSSHGNSLWLDEDLEIGSTRCETGKPGKNINVEGAFLHVLGDLIQSIGVMIGGAVIWVKPEWTYVDLFCTFLFSVLVLATTIKMLRNIIEVLMESTPREIDATKLEEGLLGIPGVLAVHELHIWAITVGKILLACHVRIDPDADADDILQKVRAYCIKDYKIGHITVQVERESR